MEQVTNSVVPSRTQGPVELDAAQLHLVSGGSPKGTWSETLSPKGTWSELESSPKGTWEA